MSLPIPDLIESIKRLAPNLPPATLIAIENDLEQKEAEVKADKGSAPKAKTEHALIVIDHDGKLAGLGDFVGFAVQVPEGTDLTTIPDRIVKATYAQNAGGKRKKWNIKTLGEIGDVKRKYLKEHQIAVKSGKQPVRVIVLPNDIPAA